MLKRLSVFKGFVIQCVRSLSVDEREAFRHWCLGIIPESKLDVNLSDDGEMYRLIEFLCSDHKLSFTDLSLMRGFLLRVSRDDMLEALERVELLISVGRIMEDYIKSVYVYGFRQGSPDMKLASRYTHIVEFLLTTREENQELISPNIEDNDNDRILQSLESAILDSQLSWCTVTFSLVIISELYASFKPVDLAENGFYVSMFSETRASEILTRWMLENGGLVSKNALSNAIRWSIVSVETSPYCE